MHQKFLIPLLGCALFASVTAGHADQALSFLDSAYRFHYRGKDDKAVEAVNKAVALNPKQPLLLMARAEFYIRNSQYEDAVKDCTEAIKLNPKASGAYSLRGFSYCQLGKFDKGIADLTRSIDLAQVQMSGWDAPFDFKNRARAYRRVGNAKAAEKDEQMARVYSAIVRARGYRSRIQLGPAISIMNDALKVRPDDKFLRYFRGISLMNDGKMESAIDDFTFVMKHDPSCLSVYYFRGDCYARIHRMQDAVNDFSTVLSKNPYVVAISDTAETGRCKGRELTYDETIVSPADVYVLRGQQFTLQKKYDKALSDFNKAVELAPNDTAARMERANLYAEMRNFPLALKDCNSVIAQHPKDIFCYELRAKILEASKQPDKALSDLTKIVDLSGTDPPAYLRRGQLYDRLGQYEKAISDYSMAIDLNHSDDDGYRFRGGSYFKLGKFDKAVDDFTQAINRDPEGNVEAYAMRASAYDKLGKPDLAARDRRTIATDSQKKKAGRDHQTGLH